MNRQEKSQNQPPIDPRVLAAMYGPREDDEIDLRELWRTIWARKTLILSVTFAVAIVAAGISLILPNIYRADVLLAPISEEGNGGGLASRLGGLGGLASLAGVNVSGGGDVDKNIAVFNSREFIWSFIKDKNLMPVLFADKWNAANKQWQESNVEDQPNLWDAYRLFTKKGLLSVSTDKDSGLVTLSIEWTDADLAAQWANLLVQRLNKRLRLKAIKNTHNTLRYLNQELTHTQVTDQRKALFDLISQQQKKAMLANTRKQFAFTVIDQAVAPDKKYKPHRALIVILASFVAGLLMVFIVLIRDGVKQRANQDEQAILENDI